MYTRSNNQVAYHNNEVSFHPREKFWIYTFSLVNQDGVGHHNIQAMK